MPLQAIPGSIFDKCVVLVLLQSAYCGDAEEYDQSQFILSSAALNSVLGLPGEHSVLSHLKNDGSSYTLQNEELGWFRTETAPFDLILQITTSTAVVHNIASRSDVLLANSIKEMLVAARMRVLHRDAHRALPVPLFPPQKLRALPQ